MQRADVPFDKNFFAKEIQSGRQMSIEEKFTYIYKTNFWSGASSVSGEGSDDQQTEVIRNSLPVIFSQFNIKSFLDIPCGDFNWMSKIEFGNIVYIGADIVEEIICLHQKNNINNQRSFIKIDIVKDPLPYADLVFCRDCLVHFSFEDIKKSIRNMKKSGSKYLLTTTFPACDNNMEIVTGDWRILNLTKDPFNFPEPITIINENCTEGNGTYLDKSLGLWKLSDL